MDGLIGKKAPDFNCSGIINKEIKKITLSDFKNKYKVIFFYPLDFTFVCPTEIHAFQEKLEEFKKRNAEIIGVSVDSVYSHQAWLSQSKDKGGIEGVTFVLLSDITKAISKAYGVLNEEEGIAYRGVFILDKNDILQSLTINNLSLGRNIDEVLRVLDALQFTEKHGDVCPANWQAGQEGLKTTKEDVSAYLSKK